MLILKTKPFIRWAEKLGVSDKSLITAVKEMCMGLFDANLGGHIYKKRIPLGNKGKSGGTRTIIAYKTGDKAIFIYGYAKNTRDTITTDEEGVLKDLAKYLLSLDQKQTADAMKIGEFIEVKS